MQAECLAILQEASRRMKEVEGKVAESTKKMMLNKEDGHRCPHVIKHSELMKQMSNLLREVDVNDEKENLDVVTKSVEYLLKVIVAKLEQVMGEGDKRQISFYFDVSVHVTMAWV
jgi:hypothetical protein